MRERERAILRDKKRKREKVFENEESTDKIDRFIWKHIYIYMYISVNATNSHEQRIKRKREKNEIILWMSKIEKEKREDRFSFHFVRNVLFDESLPVRPDALSFPLQFVFVESINRFVVTPDDASARVLTGGDDETVGGDIVDVLTIRGDDEPLFDGELVPDVRPDDDGWSCCHGGILSLLLSKRLASSNEIRFLFEINCLAKLRVERKHTDVSNK